MHVISLKQLRTFWRLPGHTDTESPLRAWYKNVLAVDWHHWAEVKRDYATASIVGDCVVFNIGGNKYRLIARVRYHAHRVYVLKIMTHDEYDRLAWVEECGCHKKPPIHRRPRSDRGRKTRGIQ